MLVLISSLSNNHHLNLLQTKEINMDHLKFVVVVLKEGKRVYGYIYHQDFESDKFDYCRFVDHKNIHDYINMNDINMVRRIDKKNIKHIDLNLRF